MFSITHKRIAIVKWVYNRAAILKEMGEATGTNMITVVEHCRVSPPLNNNSPPKHLPLTFFDIFWLNWSPVSRVYFYDFPCSKAEFAQTIVPHLKNSLASALEHYYFLCGNLIKPTTILKPTTPEIRYSNGDSVLLIIAEFSGATSEGFEHLSGYHARHVDEMCALVPRLPHAGGTSGEDDSVVISPVLSVQVTLFPGQGFSVGFSNSHVVADGKTMFNFITTWASISASRQLMGGDGFDNLNSLPFYDRDAIRDPKGIASIFLRECLRTAQESLKAYAPVLEKDLVQATFKMNQVQIQGFKNLVTAQFPHASTFVVGCAYVWTCMAKTRTAPGQDMSDENEEEHFSFMMDTRTRLDPPLHLNYFGNAILPCRCTLKSRQLEGEEGFVNAVGEIRKTIDEKMNNDKGLLEGFEMVFDRIEATKGNKIFGVAGSPKFDYYCADFGWGKPRKYEAVLEKFGLVRSRDSAGDLEIGVCFSKDEMDAFTIIFTQGLIY